MKTTLIFLWVLAGVLGIFAYFAVFEIAPTGSYSVTPLPQGSTSTFASSTVAVTSSSPTSTAMATSGPNAFLPGSGTNPTGTSSSSIPFFGSVYAIPPAIWTDSGATFAITAASLQGNELTFTLTIQVGPNPTCIPMDLSLVADESGATQKPDTPSFSFPDSGSCVGTANSAYENQTISFTVSPGKFPLLFTSGGQPNTFFEVATTSQNGLQIQLPSTSG